MLAFIGNWFINECARKKKAKIPEKWSHVVFLEDIEKPTFLIWYLIGPITILNFRWINIIFAKV